MADPYPAGGAPRHYGTGKKGAGKDKDTKLRQGMQNYCLDTLECLLEANFIRMDAVEKKTKREELQKEAIVKLKLLGYVSMVAENSGCILKKQYKQISIQLSEAINLTVAWKKSDDERWKKRS